MRSFLFVPADSPRKLEKAAGSGADVVIFDLEDAVAPGAKDTARALLAQHLSQRAAGGPLVAVRVNALDSGHCAADVAAVAPLAPDMVMLPKAEGPEDLARLDALLRRAESVPGAIGLLAVATETPAAVLSLAAQDWRHPRLRGLLWGGEDLAATLGATANRDAAGAYTGPFALARNLCLLAARRAGVLAIDAVHTDFRDTDALRAEAESARRDGFDGKAAIHPAQVPVINAVFEPSAAERDWAARVLEALEQAGGGVAVLDGAMIDAPHAARARRILARG